METFQGVPSGGFGAGGDGSGAVCQVGRIAVLAGYLAARLVGGDGPRVEGPDTAAADGPDVTVADDRPDQTPAPAAPVVSDGPDVDAHGDGEGGGPVITGSPGAPDDGGGEGGGQVITASPGTPDGEGEGGGSGASMTGAGGGGSGPVVEPGLLVSGLGGLPDGVLVGWMQDLEALSRLVAGLQIQAAGEAANRVRAGRYQDTGAPGPGPFL
ncbi:MAG: hypothetical protein JWO93_1509, partial [Micrococcaceae bacterium]|nr:hypothetical protein [Micrococcaceae bacterium]